MSDLHRVAAGTNVSIDLYNLAALRSRKEKRMKLRSFLSAAVITALSILCLFLVYVVLDASLALHDARSGAASEKSEKLVLRQLALDLAKGARRDEIEKLLSSNYARGHLIKDEDANTIFVDGVGLRFRDSELVGIIFMSDWPWTAEVDPREGGKP